MRRRNWFNRKRTSMAFRRLVLDSQVQPARPSTARPCRRAEARRAARAAASPWTDMRPAAYGLRLDGDGRLTRFVIPARKVEHR